MLFCQYPAAWVVKVQYLGAIALIPLFAEFPDAVIDGRFARPRTRVLAWLAALFFSATLLTDQFIRDELQCITNAPQGVGGPLLGVYAAIMTVLLVRIAWRLLKVRLGSPDEMQRRQAEFILLGEAFYCLCSLHDILMRKQFIYGFGTPIVEWATLVFMLIVAYTTLRYRLLEVDLVIGLGVYYSLMTVGMAIVYFAIENFAENNLQNYLPANTLLGQLVPALVVVILFGPIQYGCRRLIDAWFLDPEARALSIFHNPNFLVLVLDQRVDELRKLRDEIDLMIKRCESPREAAADTAPPSARPNDPTLRSDR